MLQYFSRVVRDDGLAVPEPFLSSLGEASSAQVPILSSSSDAFGAQVSTIAHEDNEKGMKKKRKRDSSVFHSRVLEKTGRQYSTCTHVRKVPICGSVTLANNQRKASHSTILLFIHITKNFWPCNFYSLGLFFRYFCLYFLLGMPCQSGGSLLWVRLIRSNALNSATSKFWPAWLLDSTDRPFWIFLHP